MKRIILLLLAFTFMCSSAFFSSTCTAQVLYSSDNRVSITAPDDWWIDNKPLKNDGYKKIIAIKNNNGDLIRFIVNKEKGKYKSLKDISYKDKEMLYALAKSQIITDINSQGLFAYTSEDPIIDNKLIAFVVSAKKGDLKLMFTELFFIKDHQQYTIISVYGINPYTEVENIIDSIKVDGIPLNNWIYLD